MVPTGKGFANMSTLRYTKEIDDQLSTDVLVIGGGPAGIAAAIASARNGAKTMLVEREGYVGGMATSALVGPFMTSYDGLGEVQLIRGIFDELVTRMEERGGAIHPSKIGFSSSHAAFITLGHSHVTPFDSDILKIVAEEMLLESGVTLLYYTQFIDCIMDSDGIDRVVVVKKQGLCAIKAKIYVDCSGDADVSARAGVPFILGGGSLQAIQPATMFFKMDNVDSDRVADAVEKNKHLMRPFRGAFSWTIEEGRRTGKWSIDRDELGMYETNEKGVFKLNTTRIPQVDPTKSETLTAASIEGRRQVYEASRFIQEEIPGFENARVAEVASVIGIRESRHIEGEYVLTKEDILQERTFDDDILLCANSLDYHANDGGGGEYIPVKRCYGIPYRCLVPKNCTNLLVAGKTISATSEAAAAFRVMPPCYGIGEAAGAAAALCVRGGVFPSKLSTDLLRDTLVTQNVFLDINY